jgi:general secretion pathway protein D
VDESTAAAITQALGDQLSIMGASLGGAAGVFSQAGAAGGGVGPPDYGQDLVDLIQQTIQPEFWDIHGGPGTIVYYRPLHCLVVRATSEVHHSLGGTLGALRAAGK